MSKREKALMIVAWFYNPPEAVPEALKFVEQFLKDD